MDVLRGVKRGGWTLAEMLVSLAVFGIIVALASHAAVGQLRFFRGVGEVVAVRAQTGQAAAIATRVVWGISPRAGDITVATSSELEFHAAIGSAVVCEDGVGAVSIARPALTGNALTAFLRMPDFGDRVHIYIADSLGAGWITARVASLSAAGVTCASFPETGAALMLYLQEPLVIPAGAALRFSRPVRLKLYRASDRRWYLGMQDWAGERFNTVQPLAGPLQPRSARDSETGLRFVYRDAAGSELEEPLDHSRVVTIGVMTRGKSIGAVRIKGMRSAPAPRHIDSSMATIHLRNAQ